MAKPLARQTRTKTLSAEIVGKELVIRLPLTTAAPSRSGKTMLVASSRGSVLTDVAYRRNKLMITANAFYYKNAK